jgi:dTDP-4-dehydrorhamnose reductase
MKILVTGGAGFIGSAVVRHTLNETDHSVVNSWYDFARAIFLEAEVQRLKTPSYVKSITTADYPTPAIRPAYSVLDCTKIESVFDVTRSNWRDGIKLATNRLQG